MSGQRDAPCNEAVSCLQKSEPKALRGFHLTRARSQQLEPMNPRNEHEAHVYREARFVPYIRFDPWATIRLGLAPCPCLRGSPPGVIRMTSCPAHPESAEQRGERIITGGVGVGDLFIKSAPMHLMPAERESYCRRKARKRRGDRPPPPVTIIHDASAAAAAAAPERERERERERGS